MTEHAVIISGAGPTGLLLAAELALAGVDVTIVERRPDQSLAGARSGGLQARTIEILDQRGVAERFLTAGYTAQVLTFAGTVLDISDFPTRHPYGLALWQNHFERILAEWVDELPVRLVRGHAITGFDQDDAGVDVHVAGGSSLRGQYLVACDGGRSVVRKAAGIAFTGWDPTMSSLVAEVRMTREPEVGITRDARGQHGIGPLDDAEYFRVAVREAQIQHGTGPTLAELSHAMVAVWGSDFGAHSPRWISRFTDAARQAEQYRSGRVLLAGDAAHVHSPVGGQGMNTGLQAAMNLGWKLAQVVRGTSPDTLLDSYHDERHAVGARVLTGTLAQTALMPSEPRIDAVRETIAELLTMDEPRRHLAGALSGLDIRYDLGGGHPLVGRRMPDLDVVAADGPTRVYALLHDGRGLLLNFAAPGGFNITPWAARVKLVDARHDGRWELPVVGSVAAPPAVLVRPDGHVVWVGALTDAALVQALATWFGAPR